MTTEPEPETDSAKPRRPSWRGAAFAAVYGAIVAIVGYVIGRGNLFVALVVMVLLGVLFRFYAYTRIRRQGSERPRGWKWL
jgi:uncharacterized membrane protein